MKSKILVMSALLAQLLMVASGAAVADTDPVELEYYNQFKYIWDQNDDGTYTFRYLSIFMAPDVISLPDGNISLSASIFLLNDGECVIRYTERKNWFPIHEREIDCEWGVPEKNLVISGFGIGSCWDRRANIDAKYIAWWRERVGE